MRTHDTCRVTGCDCDCAGCNPANCATCPHCGADTDTTPQEGGVTDPLGTPSYEEMSTQ